MTPHEDPVLQALRKHQKADRWLLPLLGILWVGWPITIGLCAYLTR